MAENIIYCYSGSGHCLDMAKKKRQDHWGHRYRYDAKLSGYEQ